MTVIALLTLYIPFRRTLSQRQANGPPAAEGSAAIQIQRRRRRGGSPGSVATGADQRGDRGFQRCVRAGSSPAGAAGGRRLVLDGTSTGYIEDRCGIGNAGGESI